MLRHLTVENYALIEQLDLELDSRLSIITGETGAGKSILLGALGLLLGNKNDKLPSVTRHAVVSSRVRSMSRAMLWSPSSRIMT